MSEKLKIIFSKTGDMKFISHLDLVRMFQRSSRRAEIPVTLTKGFSPHLKISIQKALKLGIESKLEEAVFYLDAKISPDEFMRCMNSNLPDGVRIVSANSF